MFHFAISKTCHVLLLAETISQRLRHLELSTYGRISRNLLLHLLKQSPKLQVLKLREIHWIMKWPVPPYRLCKSQEFTDPPLSFPNPSSVPECLSFHLKTFEWRCYKGTEGQKEVLLYILQNAACLKTAEISVHSKGRRFREKELVRIKELESVPKASTLCQLVIRLPNVHN
ncbi:putative F-box/FBD/LRR-repeat protein [Raphanus sativus]|nr:putative F-box/FBD/LRR-repeat protein [Raphanus sativus]